MCVFEGGALTFYFSAHPACPLAGQLLLFPLLLVDSPLGAGSSKGNVLGRAYARPLQGELEMGVGGEEGLDRLCGLSGLEHLRQVVVPCDLKAYRVGDGPLRRRDAELHLARDGVGRVPVPHRDAPLPQVVVHLSLSLLLSCYTQPTNMLGHSLQSSERGEDRRASCRHTCGTRPRVPETQRRSR